MGPDFAPAGGVARRRGFGSWLGCVPIRAGANSVLTASRGPAVLVQVLDLGPQGRFADRSTFAELWIRSGAPSSQLAEGRAAEVVDLHQHRGTAGRCQDAVG